MFETFSHKGEWHAVIFSDMDGNGDDHIEDRLSTERQIQYCLVLVGRERVHLLGAESGVMVTRWVSGRRKWRKVTVIVQ